MKLLASSIPGRESAKSVSNSLARPDIPANKRIIMVHIRSFDTMSEHDIVTYMDFDPVHCSGFHQHPSQQGLFPTTQNKTVTSWAFNYL